MNDQISIVPLESQWIDQIAATHQKEIIYGFTSYLGKGFLRYFYRATLHSDYGDVYVALYNGQPEGYVFATRDIKEFHRHFIRKYGFISTLRVLHRLLAPRFIRSAIQSLLYTAQNMDDGDDMGTRAEIVAIVVGPKLRGQGVGRKLLEIVFDAYRLQGITSIKVLVGDKLDANSFYTKMGFKHIKHIVYNSAKMDANIYVYHL